MRYGSVKHIALYYKAIPGMLRLLRQERPTCRVAVGGAVLTASYARQIGADFYGRDAMSTVRYAEEVFSQNAPEGRRHAE